jgi:hypothetical protein
MFLLRRLTIIAVLVTLAVVIAQPASAHTGPVHKVRTIERVYPDLYQRELAATPTSWAKLRKMASERWHRTHPCQRATLDHIADEKGYWPAVYATWTCDGLPKWKWRFLTCIPRYEGGYAYPDVRYGGGRGYPGGNGNIVFGPWQVRPGWVNGHMQTGRSVYGQDSWTWAAYEYALSPVNMARIVEGIAPSAYATAGFC